MTDMVVREEYVTLALLDLIREQTQTPVGEAFAPLQPGTTHNADFPYYELRTMDTNEFHGPPFVSLEADSCEEYMITTFGIRPDQVSLMRNKVIRVICGKDNTTGRYLYELPVQDHKIMQRTLGLKGRMRQAGTVFFTEDLYRFNVTSQI